MMERINAASATLAALTRAARWTGREADDLRRRLGMPASSTNQKD